MESKILSLIEEPIKNLGFDIVKIHINSKLGKKYLHIFIEKENLSAINIGDCKKVSKLMSTLLYVEDIIKDKYIIEVSSAGMERELYNIKDFQKFIGKLVKIKLLNMIDMPNKPNIQNFIGKIMHIDLENNINFELYDEDHNDNLHDDINKRTIQVNFDNIKKANLFVTDEMFQNILKNRV